MVDEADFPALAESVARAVNVKDGDAILIWGNVLQQKLLEEIAIHVIRRGGQPFIQALSDDYWRRMLDVSSEDQLRQVPRIMLGAAQTMDARIVIEPFNDPSIPAMYRKKFQAWREGNRPIRDAIFREPKKRWVEMGWPTEGIAARHGISLAALEGLIIGGILIDYDRLKADCDRLMALLAGARYVHVTDPHGTDFHIDIGGRKLDPDDGAISRDKEAAGINGANLPAGEVAVAPVETYGTGTIYCPMTVDGLTWSTPILGAMLFFDNGELILDKCTAEENQDTLIDSLSGLAELDTAVYGGPNALKIAELGIGLNPAIDRAIGYILTDEKIRGTVHVAFGDSILLGGNVRSHMHWDFVTAPDVTLEVEYNDGSRKFLIRNGRLLI